MSQNIAAAIDHTLLKPTATRIDIDKLCAEAARERFFSVCVNGVHVAHAKKRTQGSGVAVAAVVGFPLGAMHSDVKAIETARAIADGASEIDMVADLGAIHDGRWHEVSADIASVVRAAAGNTVKVILETNLLADHQIVSACHASRQAGAHFVKTSTGFSGGAQLRHVQLMRQVVGRAFGVKASGGIRDRAAAKAMLAAGANRIGTSAGCAIVAGTDAQQSDY